MKWLKKFSIVSPRNNVLFLLYPKYLLPAKLTDLESSHWASQVHHVQSTGWILWDNFVSPICPCTGFLHMHVCLYVCGCVCIWGWCISTCVPVYVAAQRWHWVSSSVARHSTRRFYSSQSLLVLLASLPELWEVLLSISCILRLQVADVISFYMGSEDHSYMTNVITIESSPQPTRKFFNFW